MDDLIGAIAPTIASRPSGSARTGFCRPGERSDSGAPFDVTPSTCPKYNGPPAGRVPTNLEKSGAWQLQEEYLAGRLGKNDEENSRLWNTAKWIDRLIRIATMPAEALPPLNIYVGDKVSQRTEGTGAPTGPDDEAPDEAGNEGVEFESINVGEADSERSMCVMDEDGTTRRLDIKTDDYNLLRLIDVIEDINGLAKIDINKLAKLAMPILPLTDFPSDSQRAESGKIIRILMMGMRTLWPPVIRAIAHHATMTSLGRGQGKGVAATVGRTRVIEGLRIAESIRKGLARQDRGFSVWLDKVRAKQESLSSVDWHRRSNRFKLPPVDDIIRETLALLPRPICAPVLNVAGRPAMQLPANDNVAEATREAA